MKHEVGLEPFEALKERSRANQLKKIKSILNHQKATCSPKLYAEEKVGAIHFMHYVYLLKSLKDSTKTYIGYTTSLEARIQKHNAGGSIFTADFKPWKLVVSICFEDKSKAVEFEKYLKGGSGYAFAQRRLW